MIMNKETLYHHGIKGMKWGVRRFQNQDGSLPSKGVDHHSDVKDIKKYGEVHSRTLKKGTTIQNISRKQLDPSNKKSGRIYASYTKSDNDEYIDMMGNFEYNGRGYKNTFKVKSDITIGSERDAVDTILDMYKKDPKKVSDAMAKAYNAVNVPLVFQKSGGGFDRKLTKMVEDPYSKKSISIGRSFVQTVPLTNKTSDVANEFYTRMVSKGFDAVLDTNDGHSKYGATQDPLIIFNMNKLSSGESVKLTKSDLDSAAKYVGSKEFNKRKKDSSDMAR